jgi:hypothetical protein
MMVSIGLATALVGGGAIVGHATAHVDRHAAQVRAQGIPLTPSLLRGLPTRVQCHTITCLNTQLTKAIDFTHRFYNCVSIKKASVYGTNNGNFGYVWSAPDGTTSNVQALDWTDSDNDAFVWMMTWDKSCQR